MLTRKDMDTIIMALTESIRADLAGIGPVIALKDALRIVSKYGNEEVEIKIVLNDKGESAVTWNFS